MTTWVLLRGLMRESRHWGDFPHQLQKVVPNEDIVCIDFPGNGPLNQLHSLTSIPAMADYCRQHLLTLGIKPPFHVLAISLGAMVAVAWAESFPDELKSLTLINTSLAPHNPFYHRLRPKNYPRLVRSILFGNRQKREALILQLTSQMTDKKCASTLIDQWVHYAREYPISRANILRQLRAASQFKAPEQAPMAAILMLASRQDQLVNFHCSQTLADKWQVSLRIHEQAGHDLPLDDGQWVITAIQEWRRDVFGDKDFDVA